MYLFLCRYLPLRAANAVMLLWYLLLCIVIFLFSAENESGFLYRDL